jgi:hypothetical protein
MHRGAPLCVFAVSVLVLACGGGASSTRPDCPPGQTSLDGTCVWQQIANYVGCVRATGATVASDNSKSLAAAAGAAGVTASTQADVKDRLEKRYATASDANALEIIHNCYSQTASLGSTAEAKANSASSTGGPPFHCFTYVYRHAGMATDINGDECFPTKIGCEQSLGFWSSADHWQQRGQQLVRMDTCGPRSEAYCFRGTVTNEFSRSANICRATEDFCKYASAGAACAHQSTWSQ